jgi:hypothetical protein
MVRANQILVDGLTEGGVRSEQGSKGFFTNMTKVLAAPGGVGFHTETFSRLKERSLANPGGIKTVNFTRRRHNSGTDENKSAT